MDKQLIDRTWKILPKEFKEEVKKEYNRFATKATKDAYDLGFMHAHEGMFGIPNLTSDAEGENEMETEKFKVGDKVIFKNTGKPKIVVNIAEDGRYVVTSPDGKSPYRVYGSDLKPYINPEKVSRNLSQETANCDKQLDNILSDSATLARALITECSKDTEGDDA